MSETTTTFQKVTQVEKVFSESLFASDFYQVKNWVYDFGEDKKTSVGFNDCLCFVYVRKGWFLFDLSKESYDMHTGHIVIDKPNYEYRLRPSAGACTIFNFSNAFYAQFVEDLNLKTTFFFGNDNLLSLMLKSNPETDYLHHQITSKANDAGRLEMDQLVLDLLQHIVSIVNNQSLEEDLNGSLRLNHISTIERAKDFIHQNFSTDISLYQIADHSCVSPFHFSRVFKKFTSFTPHQYLQNVRLKHGQVLLKSSLLPISDVSCQAGFNSADYFATAFKQKYGATPTEFRNVKSQSFRGEF